MNVSRLPTRYSFLYIFIEKYMYLNNWTQVQLHLLVFFSLDVWIVPVDEERKKRGQWMEKTEKERGSVRRRGDKERGREIEMQENSLISCFNTQTTIYTYVHVSKALSFIIRVSIYRKPLVSRFLLVYIFKTRFFIQYLEKL